MLQTIAASWKSPHEEVSAYGVIVLKEGINGIVYVEKKTFVEKPAPGVKHQVTLPLSVVTC